MIHRGRRQADRFHGELYVVYVQQDDLSGTDQKILDQSLEMAREAHAHIEILHGEDPIQAILDYAAAHGITQIFVGHSQAGKPRNRWLPDLQANPVERIIMEADGIDVRVFPNERSA
jgi:two-component system sensor histidine kinase KdpD